MSKIVAAARSWIGTPYVHQSARKGAGCDCLGLLRGVLAEVRGTALDPVPPYTADWSEPQGNELLLRAAESLLIAKSRDAAAPGDVLVFRMRTGAVAKHLGLQGEVGDTPSFIHSYQGHGVIESAYTHPWRRRLAARFAVPDRHNV